MDPVVILQYLNGYRTISLVVTLSPIPLLTMRLVMSRKSTTAIMVASVHSQDTGVISSTTFQVGGISCGALRLELQANVREDLTNMLSSREIGTLAQRS